MSVIIFHEKDGNVKLAHPIHTKENHEYHMTKYKRCVYCDNNIPLSDEELVDL